MRGRRHANQTHKGRAADRMPEVGNGRRKRALRVLLCRTSTATLAAAAEVDRNSYTLIASMRRRSFLSPAVDVIVIVIVSVIVIAVVVFVAAQSNVSLRSIYSCSRSDIC